MAELYVEVAPGNDVYRLADVALKAADVKPGMQLVERQAQGAQRNHDQIKGLRDQFRAAS